MESIRSTGRLVIVEEPGDGIALGEALGPGDPRRRRVVLVRVGPRGAGVRACMAMEGLAADEVRTVEVADPDDAERPHGLALVERASAVVVLGDDPGLIARLLGGTRLDAALRRLAGSIRVVAIGPAAEALGGWILEQGSQSLPGLGHLPGAILDLGIGRLDRLRAAVGARPGSTGLALGAGAWLAFDGRAVEAGGFGPVIVFGLGEAAVLPPGGRLRLPAGG